MVEPSRHLYDYPLEKTDINELENRIFNHFCTLVEAKTYDTTKNQYPEFMDGLSYLTVKQFLNIREEVKINTYEWIEGQIITYKKKNRDNPLTITKRNFLGRCSRTG